MRLNVDIDNMPVLSAVSAYKRSRPARFHVPGHKGTGFCKEYLGDVCGGDITELSFSDNLLNPGGIISRAENLCAALYSAESVKYCTCGTTTLILSLLHSVKSLGSRIIIERNSHKSVYSALRLAGLEPVIINNPYDKETGLYKHITADDVQKALSENKGVIGAVISSPDYFGICADAEGISRVLKEKGKLLLIDAAHGSHLPFILAGIYKEADAYVCSAHKTLFALTQGSFAAFNNYRLYEGFCKSFCMFHTTSPSYPIMASLDFSREAMQKNAKRMFTALERLSAKYKNLLEKAGCKFAQNDDFTRLVINIKGFSGRYAAKYLEKKGIYIELADDKYIVAVLTAADGEKSLKRLYKAVLGLTGEKPPEICPVLDLPVPLKAMPYLEAYKAEKETVPLDEAAGRVCAEDAGIFPPCYPLICCGDMISAEICGYLKNNPGSAFGLNDGGLLTVKEKSNTGTKV